MALSFLRNIRLNQISKAPGVFLPVNEELERRFFLSSDAQEDPFLVWAFGMAGPLNAKNNNPCNCFLWGGTPQDWREQLEIDWGVTNKEEYGKLLEEFEQGYHSLDDAVLIPLLKEKNATKIYDKLVWNGYKEEDASEYSVSIPIITQMFEASKWFQVPTKSLQAWDIVRASYYVLSGEEAQYISPKEALVYLNRFGKMANRYYEDWYSYTAAYLYGRKLWVGVEGGYGEESMIATDVDFERLITFTCSPYSVCRTVPFGAKGAMKMDKKYAKKKK